MGDISEENANNQRVLLKVTVEVSAQDSDTIFVHEGDDPSDLAVAFCGKHGLQDSLIAPLASHIDENLKKVLGYGKEVQNGNRIAQRRSGSQDKVSVKSAPRPAAKKSPGTPERSNSSSGLGNKHGVRTPLSARASRTSLGGRTPAGPPRPNSARQSRGNTVVKEASGSGCNSRASTPGALGRSRRQSGVTPRRPDSGEAPLTARSGTATLGNEEGGNRFERLYDEASQRQFRLEHLRKQVEQDILEQRSRTTAQLASPNKNLGERLYRNAQERQEKIRDMQSKTAERRLQEELIGVTFSPSIAASQRSWQGVGRSLRDPEGTKTKQKIDHLRQMKENTALIGCTFHPAIDPKSEQLMSDRLSRLKIMGSLYEHLYEDAQRRQERRVEYDRALPPGATFHPDIGNDNLRPPNDDNKEDFCHRLAYSKSYSERWLSLRRQQEGEEGGQGSNSQPDFHPQTGRGPTTERNKHGLPIGEFLFSHGKEKSLRSQAGAEIAERERSQASAPKVGVASRQLFEESKSKMYRDLYARLTSSDPRKQLRYDTLSLKGLSEELTEFLRPMTAYLKETNAEIDFDAFVAALDYQRQHSAVPTAHLFVPRSRSRSAGRQREADGEHFKPQIDPNSNRIAARHRPRGSAPLHEQLLREKEVWESKLQEQRILMEERARQECTFQPNATGRAGSSERSWRADAHTPRSHSEFSQDRPPVCLGSVLLSEQKAPPVTPPTVEQSGASPVTQIIHSLEAARDTAFMEGFRQTVSTDNVSFDTCQKQIQEAERTVAQCKNLLDACA